MLWHSRNAVIRFISDAWTKPSGFLQTSDPRAHQFSANPMDPLLPVPRQFDAIQISTVKSTLVVKAMVSRFLFLLLSGPLAIQVVSRLSSKGSRYEVPTFQTTR